MTANVMQQSWVAMAVWTMGSGRLLSGEKQPVWDGRQRRLLAVERKRIQKRHVLGSEVMGSRLSQNK